MSNTQYCNRCGKVLDIWDLQENFVIDENYMGYGTIYDGDSIHLQLCCGCLERLVSECAINPITESD